MNTEKQIIYANLHKLFVILCNFQTHNNHEITFLHCNVPFFTSAFNKNFKKLVTEFICSLL